MVQIAEPCVRVSHTCPYRITGADCISDSRCYILQNLNKAYILTHLTLWRLEATMTGRWMTTLLILLLMVRLSITYVVSRPYRSFDNSLNTSQSSSTVHNVTVDCGNYGVLNKIGSQCYRDLIQLASRGYPWSGQDSERHSRNNPNVADRNNILGDALDTLNHVCHIYDKSKTCREDMASGITVWRPWLTVLPFKWIFSLSVIISGEMRT